MMKCAGHVRVGNQSTVCARTPHDLDQDLDIGHPRATMFVRGRSTHKDNVAFRTTLFPHVKTSVFTAPGTPRLTLPHLYVLSILRTALLDEHMFRRT